MNLDPTLSFEESLFNEQCIKNATNFWIREVGAKGNFSDWLRQEHKLIEWTWGNYALAFETDEDRLAFFMRFG